MPVQNIQFTPGVFYMFRAITKFNLGNYGDIWQDDVVEFDGQTMRVGGTTVPAPNLRAGVKAGWLVPVQDTTTQYQGPQPAGVQVRPAQAAGEDRGAPMPIEMASEEEQVVGAVGTLQGQRDAAAVNAARTTRVAAEVPAQPQAAPPQPVQPQTNMTPPPVQVNPPATAPPPVQVDPQAAHPPAVQVPAQPVPPVVYDQPVETQPVIYSQQPPPIVYQQPPQVEQPSAQPQAPRAALQQPPPQQAAGANLPPGVRRRPLTVDEANQKNEEILALALSEEVVLPADKEQAYFGIRHASTHDKDGGAGKFTGEVIQADSDGVVSRTVAGRHGAAVGSEDAARRAASEAGMDVTRTSARAVESMVQPVASAPKLSVEDYERTMREKLYGPEPEMAPEPVLSPEEQIAALQAQIAALQPAVAPAAPVAPAPVAPAAAPAPVVVQPPLPPSHTGAQITEAPPTATEVHQPVQTGQTTQITEGVPITETGEGGATGDVSVAAAGSDLEALLPDAASSGKPKGKIILPLQDEFTWDKSAHWTRRVKKAVDVYGDNPQVIKTILGQESEPVKKRITSELKRLGKMK